MSNLILPYRVTTFIISGMRMHIYLDFPTVGASILSPVVVTTLLFGYISLHACIGIIDTAVRKDKKGSRRARQRLHVCPSALGMLCQE
jgi:hypothetical protein